HIIFLELIMGPTCSIVFENEPAGQDVMDRAPRKKAESLFTWRELGGSILRGAVITAGLLTTIYLMTTNGFAEDQIRTVVFVGLVLSNILLTFTGRSETESVFTTIRYRNFLVPLMAAITLALLYFVWYWKPAAAVFGFAAPDVFYWLLGGAVAFASVLWIEVFKWIRRL
ncbi:MAG: cation transporting ATPase C-terminal domain-containing protein, partial [Bacteroidota bacterium]